MQRQTTLGTQLVPCPSSGGPDSNILDDGSGQTATKFRKCDLQRAALTPLIPMNRRGVTPRRNLEVISNVVHVLKAGCRWGDRPAVYGPHNTIYNRFNRWSKAGT
jgi:hypothetical protein